MIESTRYVEIILVFFFFLLILLLCASGFKLFKPGTSLHPHLTGKETEAEVIMLLQAAQLTCYDLQSKQEYEPSDLTPP